METKRTNKEVLVKGLRYLGIAVILFLLGPTLVHVVLINNEKPFYHILLAIGFIICTVAVFMAFKGLKTIIRSLFDE